MSSREPMWYCHECNAEMRPLMVPDPHCALCNSGFVEKMENPNDDPREFHTTLGALGHDDLEPFDFITSLHNLLRPEGLRHHSPSPPGRRSSRPTSPGSSPVGLRFEFGGPGRPRTVIVGGGDAGRPRSPPRLSEFLRSNETTGAGGDESRIPGHLLAQYMLTFLSGAQPGMRGPSPFFSGFEGTGGSLGGNGRWGDYIFTQEALDQLITQMMENANSNRPVPATQDIMDNLPREVLEEGNSKLGEDCAVCKEEFKANEEDEDNKVVVSLPCKHNFHEGCILPWLKSSGTCPVCRHALIPQPTHHDDPTGGSSSSSPNQRPRSPRSPDGGSTFRPPNFFGLFGGNNTSSSGRSGSRTGSGSDSRPTTHRTRSQSTPDSRNGQDFPGGWRSDSP